MRVIAATLFAGLDGATRRTVDRNTRVSCKETLALKEHITTSASR